MADARRARKKKAAPSAADELRRGAEERLEGLSAASPAPEDLIALVHELRVHQIELEMQDEELRGTRLELEKQHAKYFELFDLAPVGYLTLSDKGIVGDANLTAALLLGVERQLLVGQPYSAFIFAPDRDAYYLHQRMLEQTGEPQTCELRLRRVDNDADGDEAPGHFWARLEGRPQRAADGEPPFTWVTFTDIAESVARQEALRQSESTYRTLFETMIQGVVYQSSNGEIVSANPAAERILGLSLDQMQGRTSIDPRWRAVHDDGSDFPGEEHPSMVALRTGREVQGVVMGVFNPTTDCHRWIEIDAVPQFRPGEATPHEVFTTFDDITERRRAEEALRETSDYLANLLDYANAPIVTWDPEYRLTRFNRAFEAMTGLSEDDVLGRPLGLLFPEDTRESSMEFVRQMTPLEHWDAMEIPILRADGEVRIALWNSATILAADGEAPLVTIAQGQDITERKQVEQALRQAHDELERRVVERTAEFESSRKAALSLMQDANFERERAERALAEHETLLREVHHRVKNNLNTVANILFFQSKAIDDERARHAFEDSQERIKSMARIHEHLYRSWDIATVDMGAYFRDLADDLLQVHAAGDMTIVVDAAGVRLDMDRAVPCGLLVNELLTNACQHAFPDGRGGHVAIRLARDDGACELEVRDDGVGMVADPDIEKSGSLGLRLAGMLARQLGGDLVVDSEPGRGTAFSISFAAGDAENGR